MNKEYKIRNEEAGKAMTEAGATRKELRAEGRAPGVEVLLSGINELLRSGKQLLRGINELLRSGKQLLRGIKQLFRSGKQLLRGIKQLFRSPEQYFRGKNEYYRSPEQYFRGKNEYYRSPEQYFRGKNEYFRSPEQYFRSENELSLGENELLKPGSLFSIFYRQLKQTACPDFSGAIENMNFNSFLYSQQQCSSTPLGGQGGFVNRKLGLPADNFFNN